MLFSKNKINMKLNGFILMQSDFRRKTINDILGGIKLFLWYFLFYDIIQYIPYNYIVSMNNNNLIVSIKSLITLAYIDNNIPIYRINTLKQLRDKFI